MRGFKMSRLLSKESDDHVWVRQSKKFYSEDISALYYAFIYLIIVSSALILVQSAVLHGTKYKAVRICVDVAAGSSLALSCLLLIAFSNPNLTKTAVIRDLLCFGFLQATIG
jgi:hypothetical protein